VRPCSANSCNGANNEVGEDADVAVAVNDCLREHFSVSSWQLDQVGERDSIEELLVP
jgi:hypothetical protein